MKPCCLSVIQIHRLQGWLAERQITIELSDKARKRLGEMGYDPSYGARPLKRVIQKQVQDSLARMILSGDLQDGQVVHVDVKDKKIVLTTQ